MTLLSHGLATPIEPRRRAGAQSAARSAATQHAFFRNALCRIEAAALSSCGSLHATNEDAHTSLDDDAPPFIVADGVGGGALAALASSRLVAHLQARLAGCRLDAARIERAMLEADRAIAAEIAQLTAEPGAATVALCAPVNLFGTRWIVGWVGDCRIYRIALDAGTRIEQLGRDDTFRHLGETPPPGGALDDPARMVGNGATRGANVAEHALGAGDLLVLCSDGVHRHLADEDWARILRRPVALQERCEALIATARAHGSTDDATVLLLQCARIALPGLGRDGHARAGDEGDER